MTRSTDPPASVLEWVRRWAWFALPVAVVTGSVTFQAFIGAEQLPERTLALILNWAIALTYTTVMWGTGVAVSGWMEAQVPIRSWRAVALHVGTMSAAMAVAFVGATGLSTVLFPGFFRIRALTMAVIAGVAFVTALIWNAFHYMRRFYERLREAEAAAYDARLQALRAQINPHFLFNAFNSVASLIRVRPDEAEEVVEDLADLFRYSLRASKTDAAALSQELEAVRRYLRVEKVRFRNRMQVDIDASKAARRTRLPTMTLQPLVENAVKHGVGETRTSCTVRIEARRRGDALVIRVTDTGPGFETTDVDALVERGTGLANVRERLDLFSGGAASMEILPQGVEIQVPGRGTAAERETEFSETEGPFASDGESNEAGASASSPAR